MENPAGSPCRAFFAPAAEPAPEKNTAAGKRRGIFIRNGSGYLTALIPVSTPGYPETLQLIILKTK